MAKEIKLIPPTDVRVQSAIAPFTEDMLKDEGFKDRKELSDSMFDTMKKYGGIGLTCNQVGLPFNMFVLGDHVGLEDGLKMSCFNPMIISASEETVAMKEGCLTFPFVFLTITRPRKIVVKYEDEKGDLQEGSLDGMMSRIFQHEYDHILGKNFTEYASKMKLDMAYKKAEKQMDRATKLRANSKKDNRYLP
jgi:peptide deformylase|tara:strand:+ start:45 stop:620 length:576 start_codon:yes stop_codon:yes gene_type:complete